MGAQEGDERERAFGSETPAREVFEELAGSWRRPTVLDEPGQDGAKVPGNVPSVVGAPEIAEVLEERRPIEGSRGRQLAAWWR